MRAGPVALLVLALALAPTATPAGAAPRVDLNTASHELLMTLPGIGEQRAAAIVALRERRGGLRSVDDLRLLPGFGERRIAQLRPLVTVSRPTAREPAPGRRKTQYQATPTPRGSL
jgi:competence protein ComEA